MRRLLCAGAAVAAVALVSALPARASDGLEIAPPLVEAAVLTAPSPDLEPTVPDPPPLPSTVAPPEEPPPAPAPPPTVSISQSDGGSLDVSVRVLSPGDDTSSGHEGAGAAVISGQSGPDTTEGMGTLESEPTNTNVSVRVLSSGDNGAVHQNDGPRDADGTSKGGAPTTDEAGIGDAPSSTSDAGGTGSIPTGDSTQYHPGDSRYQSASQSDSSPWDWIWILNVDCVGNVTSASTETGVQSSEDWAWNWRWEWGCEASDDPAIDDIDPSANAPPRATSAPTTDAEWPSDLSTQSTQSGDAWLWTWTFTFCGETTTISTQLAASSPASWTWDWTWNWACAQTVSSVAAGAPAPGAEAPPPAPESPPASMPASSFQAPAPEAAAPSTSAEPSLPPFPAFPDLTLEPPSEVSVVVELPMRNAATAPQVVSIATPGVAPAVVVRPFVPAPGTTPTGTTSGGSRPGSSSAQRRAPSLGAQSPVVAARPAEPAEPVVPSGGHGRPASVTTARPAPPRREPGHRAPLDLLSTAPAGPATGSAGGLVPSTLVIGLAALTGFFILAVPGSGRRIRVARELSPRSAESSPIDHPG